MPNHVCNVLKMEGIKNQPLFSNYEEKDGVYFDFNKIIPMPESLNIESGSTTDESVIYFITDRCTVPIQCMESEKKEIIKKIVNNMFSKGEYGWAEEVFRRVMIKVYEESEYNKSKMYENGKTYVSNYQQYGSTTWYDWCCNNWGTKWNAYEFEFMDDDTIKFKTAWNCPETVIQKLSEMYPDSSIEHWWADEDCGNNSGHVTYKGGMKYGDYDESCSNEAYENYVLCWGETKCLYKDEDGEWQKHSCDDCHGCD